jgi:hypothetical protein
MPGKMARSDPRPSVRVTRGVGSGQHLASVLQEGQENANIDAGLGFIWRISGQNIFRGVLVGAPAFATPGPNGPRASDVISHSPDRVLNFGAACAISDIAISSLS